MRRRFPKASGLTLEVWSTEPGFAVLRRAHMLDIAGSRPRRRTLRPLRRPRAWSRSGFPTVRINPTSRPASLSRGWSRGRSTNCVSARCHKPNRKSRRADRRASQPARRLAIAPASIRQSSGLRSSPGVGGDAASRPDVAAMGDDGAALDLRIVGPFRPNVAATRSLSTISERPPDPTSVMPPGADVRSSVWQKRSGSGRATSGQPGDRMRGRLSPSRSTASRQ